MLFICPFIPASFFCRKWDSTSPNPPVYLSIETPNAPSSQMVLFSRAKKKKSRQPELFVFKFHDQFIYIVKITYCTFFLVKMDMIHSQINKWCTLITYMALVGHTQWGHMVTFNLGGSFSLTPGRLIALFCFCWKGSTGKQRKEGKKYLNRFRVIYRNRPTCKGYRRFKQRWKVENFNIKFSFKLGLD